MSFLGAIESGAYAGGEGGGIVGAFFGPEAIPIGGTIGAIGGGVAAGAGYLWLSSHMSNANNKSNAPGASQTPAQACSTCPPPKKKADPIKDDAKLRRQMKQRGWTDQQIQDAIDNGQQFPAQNFQSGGPATRYVNPQTGQSVIIDNTTGGVIHVGGPGFKY